MEAELNPLLGFLFLILRRGTKETSVLDSNAMAIAIAIAIVEAQIC